MINEDALSKDILAAELDSEEFDFLEICIKKTIVRKVPKEIYLWNTIFYFLNEFEVNKKVYIYIF